jgi:CheY-like chemotaxis protein
MFTFAVRDTGTGDAGRRWAAAVDAFQSGRFDLVLMDVQMPEMNGVEAVAAPSRTDLAGRSRA